MSATLTTTAAAGWYHDPNDSTSWRWWDGVTWTSHVRPMEQTAPLGVVEPITAPVAEAPAQPMTAPVIPQPAQPIQHIQPLSLTPQTPASEQEYWHSPGAEVVHIPGRSADRRKYSFPNSGSGAPGANPYGLHEWGDVGSPQTPGIWLLACLPIMSIVIQVVFAIVLGAVQGTTGTSVTPPNIVFYAILIVLAWIFAGLDVHALRLRGYTPPKIWWMLLLPPLAYFIARGRVVRREGQRAWPPELLFFLSFTGLIFVGVVLAVFVLSVMGGLVGTLV